MTRSLSKLFNIRTSEWGRLILLCSMLFLYVVGWTWAASITEAAFIGEDDLGIQALPWLFMVRAVIFVPVIALYTLFADRVSNTRLLIAILMAVGLGILLSLSLLSSGLDRIAFAMLFLLFFILDEIFATHWYTYINDFLDTRSAKRIIPVLTSSAIVASVVGGWTMPLLTSLFAPAVIVMLWFATLVVVAVLAELAPRLITHMPGQNTTDTRQAETPSYTSESSSSSHLKNVREGYRFVVQSSFLRWMAASTFILIMLLAFLEYQTSQILLSELESVENIASFTGRVVGIGNMIMFPLQLFFLNRIIGRLGIGNANLVFPVGNLAFSGALIAAPSLSTAGVAYFSRTNFYSSVGYLTDGLLYNAVPLRVKARARAFIGGLIMPLGLLVGGLVLLLVPVLATPWFLLSLIGLFAVAHVVSTVIIRRKYTQALITMLEEEDFSFLLAKEAAQLPVSDPSTLENLRKKLEDSTSDEFTIFVAKLISQVGGSQAVPILGDAARTATSPLVRSAILDILNAEDVRDDAVATLYIDFLKDPDARVRQSALAALADIYDIRSIEYLDVAQDMLNDPDVDVRTQALVPLLNMEGTSYGDVAAATLEEMHASDDPHLRARAISVLRQLESNSETIQQLVDALNDPSDEVRFEVALAFEDISLDILPRDDARQIVERISVHVKDPVERVRKTSLVVLGRLNSARSLEVFLHAIRDPSREIRNTAVDILATVGKQWNDTLISHRRVHERLPSSGTEQMVQQHEAQMSLGRAAFLTFQSYLESSNPRMRKMAAVVMSRIDPEHYQSHIPICIYENLQTIYQMIGRIETLKPLTHYTSVNLLVSALGEYNQQLLDEIFYMLGAVESQETLNVITEALKNSASHIRANAIEALETITNPHIASLIEPLFSTETSTSALLDIGNATWGLEQPSLPDVVDGLATNPYSPWMRTMMTLALGEIGAALPASTSSPTPAPAPHQQTAAQPAASRSDGGSRRRSRRGASVASLFDALDDNSNDDKQEETPAPATPTPSPPASPAPNLDGLTRASLEALIQQSSLDNDEGVQIAAQSASRMMAGKPIIDTTRKEELVLSTIERIIFLKGVPFFESLTVEQLKVLATVCEELFFEKDTRIVNQGDPGGTLYMIINGRVTIEVERRKGSFARLSSLDAHSYFGEANLFDGSPHDAAAIAVQDTMILQLRREPLVALARQYPDLSLELINVLSLRLREAQVRIAELTRTRPRELHNLFDKLD